MAKEEKKRQDPYILMDQEKQTEKEKSDDVHKFKPFENDANFSDDSSPKYFPNFVLLRNYSNSELVHDKSIHHCFRHMKEQLSIKNQIKCALIPISLHAANYEYDEFLYLGGALDFSSSSSQSNFHKFYLPMFVYIFLRLLKNNGTEESEKFFLMHEAMFLNNKSDSIALMKQMRQLKRFSDIEYFEYLKRFWENNYIISCSSTSLDKLVSFLESLKSSVLLTLLRNHFIINVFPLNKEENDGKVIPKLMKDSIASEISCDDGINNRSEDFYVLNLFKFVSPCSEANPNIHEIIMEVLSVTLDEFIKQVPCQDCFNECLLLDSSEELNATNQLFKICQPQHYKIAFELKISAADVTVDQSLIALCYNDEKIRILNRESSCKMTGIKSSKSVQKDTSNVYSFVKELFGHEGLVLILRFSNTNNFLLSGSKDKSVLLWSMTDFKILRSFKHESVIYDLDISPDFEFFISATENREANLWRIKEELIYQRYCGHLAAVKHVRFHPNSMYIATSSLDNIIRLFDTFHGKRVREFVAHLSEITAIAFTVDGKFLVSSDTSGHSLIWNISTSECITVFEENFGILSFVLNSKNLYSINNDYVLTIRNLQDEIESFNRKTARHNKRARRGIITFSSPVMVNLKTEGYILSCFKVCSNGIFILYGLA